MYEIHIFQYSQIWPPSWKDMPKSYFSCIYIYIYKYTSFCVPIFVSLWSFWQVGYWQKWCHWSRWIKECLACGRTTSNVTWLAIITTGQSTPPWRNPEIAGFQWLMKTHWFSLTHTPKKRDNGGLHNPLRHSRLFSERNMALGEGWHGAP